MASSIAKKLSLPQSTFLQPKIDRKSAYWVYNTEFPGEYCRGEAWEGKSYVKNREKGENLLIQWMLP